MEEVGATAKPDAGLDDLLTTPHSDSLVFSEKERTILDLWGLEEELRLEQGLLEAQAGGVLRLVE